MAGRDDNLDRIKQKYSTVFELAQQLSVRIDRVDLKDARLSIEGVAGSPEAKNRILDQVETVDPAHADIAISLAVDDALTDEAGSPALIDPQGVYRGGLQYYTIQTGDTLESISELFYGTRKNAQKILDANRDAIGTGPSDKGGQIIVIPTLE